MLLYFETCCNRLRHSSFDFLGNIYRRRIFSCQNILSIVLVTNRIYVVETNLDARVFLDIVVNFLL